MQEFYITKDKEKIKIDAIKRLLEQTYWAKERSIEQIEESIKNSMCYSVFQKKDDKQVGFARVITDYATIYYICDVIVDLDYRGYGLGKKIMQTIESDEEIKNLRGILATRDAHGLYEKFGFENGGTTFMQKPRK